MEGCFYSYDAICVIEYTVVTGDGGMLKMSKIAVLFPGIGYHKDKPLLYYSMKIAKEDGYQPVYIDFSSIAWDKADLRDPEKMKELFIQATGVTESVFSDVHITAEDRNSRCCILCKNEWLKS